MRHLLLTFSGFAIALSLIFGAQPVLAGPFDEACKNTPQASTCQDVKKENDKNNSGGNSLFGPDSILSRATSLVALFVGITSVIMIIIGGIKFVTSSGDSSGVSSARNTVLYALIGLVIAAAAQSIVVFVINKL